VQIRARHAVPSAQDAATRQGTPLGITDCARAGSAGMPLNGDRGVPAGIPLAREKGRQATETPIPRTAHGGQGGVVMQYTRHARLRTAQRRPSPAEVELVEQHGRRIHRTGIIFYFLGHRDLPARLSKPALYERLVQHTLALPEG